MRVLKKTRVLVASSLLLTNTAKHLVNCLKVLAKLKVQHVLFSRIKTESNSIGNEYCGATEH